MPNFCGNFLQIKNATSDQIQRIVDSCECNQLLGEFCPEPDWRQTPNEQGWLPGPNYKRCFRGGNAPARDFVDNSRFPDGTADQRWYSWRTNESHWGVKWEPTFTGQWSEGEVTIEDGVLTLNFQTAWCPPSTAWFERLSAAMPQAEILCTFSETGMMFYGITSASYGDAYTIVEDLDAVRQAWIKKNFTAEQIEIAENEDHEDYDEVYDLINEAWCDAEADELDEAYGRLMENAAEYA